MPFLNTLPSRLLNALRTPTPAAINSIKALVLALGLLPLGSLLWAFLHEGLGANPVETLEHATGDWCLRFLLITLAITPLRQLTHANWLLRLRRMLGLYAFFYGCLHFLTYLVFDQDLSLNNILRDIAKRPFITIGFLALLLMLPLALTSFNAAIRWLGGKRWQWLHRLVYAIAVLGVLHYLWLVKRDLCEPLIYAVILVVLLATRLVTPRMKKARLSTQPDSR